MTEQAQDPRQRRRIPGWLVPVALFDLALRAVAIRRALRRGHRRWAAALLIVNSTGVLPLVYLRFFQREGAAPAEARAASAETGTL